MWRDHLLLTVFIAAAAPAWAESYPPSATHPIDLTAGYHGLQTPAADEPTLPASADDQSRGPIQLPGISWGQPPAEFGGQARKRAHFATVRLQGMTLFGGSIGASVDGRSAHFSLTWPTGN